MRKKLFADNRLGIGGAAKPCDSNGARLARNPGNPDLPRGREPPESYSTDYGWGLFRDTNIDNAPDIFLNGAADLKKTIFNKGKETSGYYKIGTLWEKYFRTAPSQDSLKNRCESKKNFFGKNEKVSTFISSKEVQQLFGPNKEAN